MDIGSKRDIHDLLLALSRSGTAMLVLSDDLAEVVAISHRILVMAGGKIVREHAAAEVDEHRLAEEIAGGVMVS